MNKLMQKSLKWVLVVGLMAALPVLAEKPSQQAAQDLVEKTANKFIELVKEKKKEIKQDPEVAQQLAREVVLPHFDFKTMSKRVLARYWRVASDAQKQRFQEEFKNLLLRTYSRSIVEYSDEKVKFFPYKPGRGENEVIVRTEVQQAGGKSIPIDYRMEHAGEWKVTDVKIEEVSLVINYRNTFARDIRRMGMDKFLDHLAARNKEKASGTS